MIRNFFCPQVFLAPLWAIGIVFLSSGAAVALPTNSTAVRGEVTVERKGSFLNINASNNAVIDWESFSVDKDEHVHIALQDASCRILNRVRGMLPSEIAGHLTSNGSIYLVNEAGIVILPKGKVSSHDVTLTTFNVSNDEFIRGHSLIFEGSSPSSIVNFGTIECQENIVILAEVIDNNNALKSTSGGVLLGSTHKKECGMNSQGVCGAIPRIDNSGTITGPTVTLYSVHPRSPGIAICNCGAVIAPPTATKHPSIVLSAPQGVVAHKNLLRAEGGSVAITGNTVYLKKSSVIDVSGRRGGGKVMIRGINYGKKWSSQPAERTIIEEGALIRSGTCNSDFLP